MIVHRDLQMDDRLVSKRDRLEVSKISLENGPDAKRTAHWIDRTPRLFCRGQCGAGPFMTTADDNNNNKIGPGLCWIPEIAESAGNIPWHTSGTDVLRGSRVAAETQSRPPGSHEVPGSGTVLKKPSFSVGLGCLACCPPRPTSAHASRRATLPDRN